MTTEVRVPLRFHVAEVERVSAWEWAQAAVLSANLVWTTLCLGGYRPETMLVTLALTAVLLLVHFAACAAGEPTPPAYRPVGWWVTPFLAYALVNVLAVSPVPWRGWLDWFGWANMAAVFWVMLKGIRSPRARIAVLFVLVSLGVIGVMLGCYQRFLQSGWLPMGREQAEQFLPRASGSFGIPNSLAAFLLLLLPVTGALAVRRRARATERVWWGWVTLVFGLGLLLTASRGGWIALALAVILWPLGVGRLNWKRRVVTALAVLAMVTAAGTVLYRTAPKLRDRFDQLVRDSGELSRPILWRAGWKIFREHPILGSGAGSYAVEFERHRPPRFRDDPQWAHNEYLNTASDYGALGLLLLVGTAGAAIRHARRPERSPAVAPPDALTSRPVRAGFAIGVLAFAIQSFVDFHLKIPALAMSLAVVAALAIAPPAQGRPALRPPPSGATRSGWIIAMAVMAIAITPVLRFHQAEALRYGARQVMDHYTRQPAADPLAFLSRAENDLRRATALAPRHGGAWADLAYALELRAQVDPAQIAATAEPALGAARRATELSARVPEFWIRLGVALDLQGRREEAGQAFERCLQLAPRNFEAWYYYAYHLSADTEHPAAALRAIATGLSLDPGNRAAEALQEKLNGRASGARFIQ